MSTAIFNRADFQHPADGWYQIEPGGVHLNRAHGVEQVIDDRSRTAIVNQFNAAAAAAELSHGRDMLIDHEHFASDPEKETIAYGWLTKLQNRADGIYGQIRWTDVGQAAVDGGSYRFFSTEYDPKDLVALGGDPPRVRPMRLCGLSLTNMPNNKGGSPITNRAAASPNRLPESSAAGADPKTAAQLIANLAKEERHLSGASLSQSWVRVMNRDKGLTRAATGGLLPGDVPGKEPESRDVPADIASRLLLQLAQKRALPGYFANLAYVRNRFPRLARIANREAGWDALADLEPVAHAAYMAGSDPEAERRLREAQAGLKSKFPGLNADGIWAKVKELCPQDVSRYETAAKVSAPDFQKAMQSVTLQFPQLGVEERWEKIKELYPNLFWSFVLSFDGSPEK